MTPKGAARISLLRSRLEAAFDRARSLLRLDAEIQSDYARYLCILVSGYFEKAVTELAIDHCRTRSNATVLSYAEDRLSKIQNLNHSKLIQLVRSFDKSMAENLENYTAGARKDALSSVIDLRNSIAHGDPVQLTLTRIRAYYQSVDEIVRFLEAAFK